MKQNKRRKLSINIPSKKSMLLSFGIVICVMSIITGVTPVKAASLIKGDGNGDGIITSADAFLVSKSMNGKLTLTPEQKTALDVNNDNKINDNDKTLIIDFYLKKIKSFPTDSVNHAPEVANTINNLTAAIKDGAKTVSLANVFSDADGDALTYSVVSSNPGVATVGINGTDLTVTPVTAGTSTITVTANDGKGGTVQTQFIVTVNSVTNAVTPKIDTQPVDQTVNVGDSTSLSVTASGGASLSYQWYSNTTNSTNGGTAISGATSATYAVPTGTAGTTYYYCVVTNTDSSATGQKTAAATSSVAKVTFEAVVQKGLFFSELVWGQNDGFLQAIELYNPTGQNIDASKIRIERSDGGEPITLANGTISSGGTFTIVESFYFGTDVPVDYNTMMNFYADDSQPVTLSLYYDNKLMDIGVFYPHKSFGRVSGTVIGNTTVYDSKQWKYEGADYIDDLGKFTPDSSN